MVPNLSSVDGVSISGDGQTVLSGRALDFAQQLDRLFCFWAGIFKATEERHSPLVSADQLHKLEYFKSFPHQVILPVSLLDDEENLNVFAENPVSNKGILQPTKMEQIHQCLAPAACFPIYMSRSDNVLQDTQFVTVKSSCFRKEKTTSPLQRQTTFTMREVVCLGTQEEVQRFLEKFRHEIEEFFRRASIPVEFERATDPFFNAPSNKKYIMQKISPLKHEMVYDKRLAIGSINFHQNSFGTVYNIRCGGAPVFSGCVAFGLERWLFAVIDTFGEDMDNWPDLESLMVRS